MKYLLDSNIIIALTMNADAGVVRRAGECFDGDIVTSAVAMAEVALGSVRGKPPGFVQLQAFLEEVPVLPFDIAAARAYATIPFKRRSFDRLIAAQALSQNLIMVTDNEKDFHDIPGLKVENWTQ
ncbi:type II toxin-antitoxin system VapC family toxin [Blastomonas fulva]|jgi:tRNA(fMet)-specific endonuclease VapC|uniref:type II toxin-antitoxin system VapC family toxin n=1 Tax=Blastomonas fulva TaxID=1550728 RepID=UPI0025A3FC6E|nr:type II toxin-antitoxin system VapC family toxin [Blastomonas fulva]MDM7929043.1 type II toxin-antitoxin system VapC family toxin [Blastomonas fulva]MDM7967319.1 type II toxin-antitoxin system VapC family toxin [Blastomonas fulva]